MSNDKYKTHHLMTAIAVAPSILSSIGCQITNAVIVRNNTDDEGMCRIELEVCEELEPVVDLRDDGDQINGLQFWVQEEKQAPPEQLMTLEEQREFVEISTEWRKAPAMNDGTQRAALFNFIFRLLDKIKAKEAEAPADGSTD